MAKLYFYYSAMNAGKTTVLLQSSYNYNERGMHTCLYIPNFDTRGGYGKIASRIGLGAQAIPFANDTDLYADAVHRHGKQPLACVLLDEAQFLTKTQVRQLVKIVDALHIPVLTYGLRTDFMGEPFEGSQYLLALADNIIEIKTICHCGRKATMNIRVDADGKPQRQGEQVEIGGNERYVAVCRKHFYDDTPLRSVPPVQAAAMTPP